MTDLEKRLLALQQKIESLTAEVADLVVLASDATDTHILFTNTHEVKPLANRPFTEPTTAEVGLNRFRQLAQESV